MKPDKSWVTALSVLVLFCMFTLTAFIVKSVSNDKTQYCRDRGEYENYDTLKNITTIVVSPKKDFSTKPYLGNNLISMKFDLLATKNNPQLILFMLKLPKMTSPYLK